MLMPNNMNNQKKENTEKRCSEKMRKTERRWKIQKRKEKPTENRIEWNEKQEESRTQN